MVKQTIQIYARLKPTKAKTGVYELDDDDDGHPRLTITVPRDLADGFINNKKENYKFRFQKVFDQNSKQDEVFETVSQPVIDNVLQGYNGTIFAYGQTGSGKTFTITGGAERYMDRGIIPRSLSYIFAEMQKNSGLQFTLHVSYLEIYNESGYDLLDPKHEAAKLEDLPKVSLMEDTDQNIHLKNLSVHQANNEEDALNLLFLGDTNRMIAETPMNQASTRSHCIFTVHLSSRESTSATIRRAKLHLVDLAGSERVAKSGVNGMLLTEAKYINLSLHYLEQVIIALSEKNRQHIPYRNSLMTSVLRDSLGGNCMTTMIATCSVDKRNIDESISTCRFAQRVAMIKNDVTLNEELDPKLMIIKLKQENQQLKEEIQLLTGEQRNDELCEEDMERCGEMVMQYLNDPDPNSLINVGSDTRKIQQCFRTMKKTIKENPPPVTSPEQLVSSQQPDEDTGPYRNTEVNKLKELVIQRDNEINILVGMLKKEKKRASDALAQPETQSSSPHRTPSSSRSSTTNGHGNNYAVLPDVGDQVRERPSSDKGWMQKEKERLRAEKEERTKANILGDMSMGRQEAFEIFRRDYEHNATIDEHKNLLRHRYTDAKRLGEQVNMARTNINQIKSQIEQHRLHMAMQSLADPESLEPGEGELELRNDMEQEKTKYKEYFGQLKTMKTEIEHLQHLLEKSKVKLLKDFELWWAEQVTMAQKTHEYGASSSRSSTVKKAWRTPPVTPPQHSPIKTSIHASERLRMTESDMTSDQVRSSQNYPRRNMLLCNLKSPNSDDSYTSGYNTQNTSSENQQQLQQNRANYDTAPIPLTGDARADADIMAFVKARQNILKRGQVPR